MSTNEERRAKAKRKLQRHLERQAQQERRRRILTIVGSSVAVVVAIAAIAGGIYLANRDDHHKAAAATSTSASPAGGVAHLPPFTRSANVGADCQYPLAPEPASKPVDPPRAGKVSTDPPQTSANIVTDQGPIGLLLANNESPCTVNSFTSLAKQKFFDDTHCHRLTTSPKLGVLQCGDPKGDGTGGPGYQFANEYPTDQYKSDDPALRKPVLYPRGTLAMANTGADTNGSQFFLVYKDSQLPPGYTVFGTIRADGLATLDKVARAGVAGGGQDGAPVTGVTIKSVQVG
ncbi:peptidylprolyl isomerase [Mycobacterium heidelbergense]|uniref:Peptidyl-prolyl cis-trans isomerase n=1 Tax=Mycobacterium heidelbergense TaxID=53376 RepID=A0A1X0DH46_MYCHE|nr:peptidylprolyl isomerase [Mycobacterium heidelbergense]MCV7051569.1 peptidylprolyl isomerase [Mycobacterium heidelbergense]ORA71714.1 peptidylprolyl isomerase [Mycobacterium heidelbergense]BBZ52957.1 peptidyl-prolyl cis-trans isomerase [Mycobacterium heidelbergense]